MHVNSSKKNLPSKNSSKEIISISQLKYISEVQKRRRMSHKNAPNLYSELQYLNLNKSNKSR